MMKRGAVRFCGLAWADVLGGVAWSHGERSALRLARRMMKDLFWLAEARGFWLEAVRVGAGGRE